MKKKTLSVRFVRKTAKKITVPVLVDRLVKLTELYKAKQATVKFFARQYKRKAGDDKHFLSLHKAQAAVNSLRETILIVLGEVPGAPPERVSVFQQPVRERKNDRRRKSGRAGRNQAGETGARIRPSSKR